jgi:ribosomal protein L37E
MIYNQAVKADKTNNKLKFSHCPKCGRKGLYHVHRQYSRCRYCGLYRISIPGQDF